MDPSKLVGISYGQFRPVDTFETREGRAKNRRVEFLIVDAGADIKSMNEYYDEYYSNIEAGSVTVTDGVAAEPTEGFTPVEGGRIEGEASMMPDTEGEAEPSPEPAAERTDRKSVV